MAKFNMGDFAKTLGAVPELVTDGRKQIEYIDIDLLHEDPRNFYEVSGVDELASNIALFGLMDPLLVRSAEDGTVQIMPLKRLWAYGNYTRFLHPGYVRVDVTGAQELLPVAFEGLQDGRMQRVIILINESAEPRSAALEGCTEGFTALQVHETSDAHDLDKVYDGPVLPSVTLPGRSVVTLVLHA